MKRLWKLQKYIVLYGKTNGDRNGIINSRPFRNPHYTISTTGLIGGGRIPKPGEISLAHNGILFLDELPEFSKSALEALRGPLEDKNISIKRINGNAIYPCKFMMIASMNPCPCGYYGSKEKACKCTELQIKRYKSKISGPLLDRIDIKINVPKVDYEELGNANVESSADIRKRVNMARKIQVERYKEHNIFSNSELNVKMIEKYCNIDNSVQKLLEKYFEKLKLNARSYFKILKVSRTIADLDKSEDIKQEHVLEAIQLIRN